MDLQKYTVNGVVDYRKIFDNLPEDIKKHSQRVSEIGLFIYQTCYNDRMYQDDDLFNPRKDDKVAEAIKLHDIGKIGMLNLNHDSITIIEHTERAFEIFETSLSAEGNFDIVSSLAFEAASSHHEHWDGSGLPSKMSGEAVSLIGRIAAIANYLDHLLYEDKLKFDAIIFNLLKQSGTEFDPTIVGSIVSHKKDLKQVMQNISEQIGREIEKKLKPKKPAVKKARGAPIELHFQPVIDQMSNQTLYIESIIKLTDRYYGSIPSEVFLPIAEKTNQITELNKWNFEEVCDVINRLKENNLTFQKVIVNVSVKSITKRSFLQFIRKMLNEKDLTAQNFILEISDRGVGRVDNTLISAIDELRRMGFGVCLINFGSENSSFDKLNKLDVDSIRIDSEYIEEMGVRKRTRDLVASIIEMSRKLGISTIADGVENKDQVDTLVDLGCSIMQGSFYSQPLNERQLIQSMAKAVS